MNLFRQSSFLIRHSARFPPPSGSATLIS
jgi:hypothetical protein